MIVTGGSAAPESTKKSTSEFRKVMDTCKLAIESRARGASRGKGILVRGLSLPLSSPPFPRSPAA